MLVKMLMEIDPLPMRGSLVMTMVMIFPSRREVSPAEQLRRNPRLVPPRCRLVVGEFRPVSLLMRQNSTAMRRNLGGTNLGLQRSCSAGESSLREGKIITIVITNDPLIGRGSISINIFTSTISSQNPSSSLVSNLVSKPQICTCGLLVVLITPCS